MCLRVLASTQLVRAERATRQTCGVITGAWLKEKDLPAHADVLEARVVGGIQLLQPLQVLQIVIALWPRFVLDLISPGCREVSLGALSTLAPFPAPSQSSCMAVPLAAHALTHCAPRFARRHTPAPDCRPDAPTRRLRRAPVVDTALPAISATSPHPPPSGFRGVHAQRDQAARGERCRTQSAVAHVTGDDGLLGKARERVF